MFIELIPQRKLHGGGQRGGGRQETWEFFLLQKMIFFFLQFVGWKKNLQFNFSAGKQFCFLLCFCPGEQCAPGSFPQVPASPGALSSRSFLSAPQNLLLPSLFFQGNGRGWENALALLCKLKGIHNKTGVELLCGVLPAWAGAGGCAGPPGPHAHSPAAGSPGGCYHLAARARSSSCSALLHWGKEQRAEQSPGPASLALVEIELPRGAGLLWAQQPPGCCRGAVSAAVRNPFH